MTSVEWKLFTIPNTLLVADDLPGRCHVCTYPLILDTDLHVQDWKNVWCYEQLCHMGQGCCLIWELKSDCEIIHTCMATYWLYCNQIGSSSNCSIRFQQSQEILLPSQVFVNHTLLHIGSAPCDPKNISLRTQTLYSERQVWERDQFTPSALQVPRFTQIVVLTTPCADCGLKNDW